MNNGTINTIAGNIFWDIVEMIVLATDTEFNNSTHVAVSSTGLVYITDQKNQCNRLMYISIGLY
jgi:hypothetical protein